jgi:predicted dithiol-disulfide oxidoreductase (DUF899 family)
MDLSFPNETSDYRTARARLLAQEIELRRSMEALARARRALPPGGAVPEDYVFDEAAPMGARVRVNFSQLFAPAKESLLIYNFMFPRHPDDARPGPRQGACPSCVALLDQLDGAADHMTQRINFAVVAKAPIEQVAAFGRDRGWRHLRLLSSAGNTFKRDYHGETADGSQQPMLNVFHRAADGIRHFWSSEMLHAPTDSGQDPRHVGTIEPLWSIFDLTPDGRGTTWEEQLSYDDCCE